MEYHPRCKALYQGILTDLLVHARGLVFKGTFTPTKEAGSLSKAPHFNRPSTPVLVRFSSSTGFPNIPDTDPGSNPRGIAIRFVLAETPRREHTDIIGHSVDAFPGATGEEALGFFSAVRDGTVGDYVGAHPRALAFMQTPKPTPAGLGRERYYALHAFRFVATDGTAAFVRYRIEPVAGVQHLSEAEAHGRPASFLYDELPGSLPVEFRLTVQVAEDGDVTDDNTAKWPETRRVVDLGLLRLEAVADDQEALQKHVIFDPVPRVDGIEPSADPLLEVRAGVYLISGKERRTASPAAV
jgi:catalase